MSAPSPFDIGRAVSENISGVFQEQRDISALDKILQDASINGQESTDNAFYQILSKVSPERQPMALNILSQKQKTIAAKQSKNEQTRLANEIERSNPGSSLHSTIANIYRSDLSLDEKERMIKNISQSVAYKAEQQERLRLDSTLKRYNSRIKEIDASIKTARYEQRLELEKQKRALQDERDLLLNFETLDTREEKKEKFDFSNEKHKSRRDAALKEAKGDRKKAQEILEKEFEL